MTGAELLAYCLGMPGAAYIGRTGWNTLDLNKTIAADEIREAVDDSYATVVSNLAKKHRPPG